MTMTKLHFRKNKWKVFDDSDKNLGWDMRPNATAKHFTWKGNARISVESSSSLVTHFTTPFSV
jgi:hypothetical protein